MEARCRGFPLGLDVPFLSLNDRRFEYGSLLHDIMQVFFILLEQLTGAHDRVDFSTAMEGLQLGPRGFRYMHSTAP